MHCISSADKPVHPARRPLASGVAAAAAVATALALAACGGGSGSDPAPPAAPPGGGPISSAADRIEPYDTASAVLRKSAAVAAAGAPQEQSLAQNWGPTQAAPAALVLLPALAAGAGEASGAAPGPEAAPDDRQHIGVARPVVATATPAAVNARLQWQADGQGMQRAAVRFRSEGAFGVRLGVQVQALPPGSRLRFHGGGSAAGEAGEAGESFTVPRAEVLAAMAADGSGSDTLYYWSPDFGGPETVLEVELPAGADPAQLALAVPVLSHFFIAPAHAARQAFAKALDAGSCHADVACRPELDAQSRSVARLLFVDRGNSYQCSGTLLNDARSSTTPYLLSAQHCIGSQAAAATVTTDWFYRAAACNSAAPNPATQRVYGGATLLYASADTDTAFLRMNAPAPAGTVFAGSYLGGVAAGTPVLGLHHPQGGVQKASEGRVQQFVNCQFELCQVVDAQVSRFMAVDWSVGRTEQGSSGSPLFVSLDGGGSARYVAGQLFGGTSSCQAPRGTDYYGRFDVAFHTALRQWLKPAAP